MAVTARSGARHLLHHFLADAQEMESTKTSSMTNGKKYANTSSGKEICALIESHRMTLLT